MEQTESERHHVETVDRFEQQYRGQGLTGSEQAASRQAHGDNHVAYQQTTFWQSTVKRLWGPIPWLLEAAIVFELALGKLLQAVVVVGMLLFSAIDGAIQERRANRALKLVQQGLVPTARTLSDGQWAFQPADDLVVGDIIHLRAGDMVPADARIVVGQASADESAVTGETVAVARETGDLLTAASMVVGGEVIAEVSAVGATSSYGKTVTLAQTADVPGRLERLLFTVVRYLAYLDAALTVVLVIAAIFHHTSWQELLPFIAILIIATIPVSMPASFTVANAVEAQVLARENILATGLSGIQEAGTMDVLLVDKTGTLTENKQALVSVEPVVTFTKQQLLSWARVATSATAQDAISKAVQAGTSQQAAIIPTVTEFIPFDARKKVAEAKIIEDSVAKTITFGAPEAVATRLNLTVSQSAISNLADQGQRVLAVGVTDDQQQSQLVGLLGFSDTLQPNIADQIAQLKAAGIRIVMLTGDGVSTAQAIAGQIGLTGAIVNGIDHPVDLTTIGGFANVYPQDKQTIVQRFQEAGNVVGMIGDGVNDAAALHQADVGMAVSNARDIAKQAARLVLAHAGLIDVGVVVASGRRVYQRMMTWTITKLSRTAVLTALLTFGFMLTGRFPISLNLIVLIVVLNDLVTLVLGTDRTGDLQTTPRWDLPTISRLAAWLATGWLIVGLAMIILNQQIWHFSAGWVSSTLLMYLMFSSMMTILMTRTDKSWWRSYPSRAVSGMVGLNIVVTIVIVTAGWLTGGVSVVTTVLVLGTVLIVGTLLDAFKQRFYRRHVMGSDGE
ncbi:HAD-IC family P-type ATPase [Furfurilactobacillus entadae]|uniref:HAD-IC family P-type ATPase n=1 Tax=Furfurilactobacillus entadae TaxID=2922307 RepID=UPI0035F0C1A7